MALASGALMEVADYNNLALEVNKLYSDVVPDRTYEAIYDPITNLITNAATCNAIFSQSAAINTGYVANSVFSLTEPYVGYGDPAMLGDTIVVVINSVTLIETTDWTINYTTNAITILGTIAAAVDIAIYNRTEHKFGWGQSSSVYPHPVFPTDSKGNSSVLEANVNNIVDKVNIMSTRVGNLVSLSRVAQAATIYYSDKTTIQTQIDTNILPSNYWTNTIAAIDTTALSMTQTTLWTSKLTGTFGWTFANYQAARYFFNAGNQLLVNVTMTGATTDAGYLNWNQVATQLGSVVFDLNTTSQTGAGGVSNNIGFYDLTDVFQPIFTGAAPIAPYSGDATTTPVLTAASNFANLHAVFDARYTTTNGNHAIEIRLTMDDSAYAQDIAGTTIYNAGHKVSNVLINNSATYSIATPIIIGVSSLSNTFVPGSNFVATISTNHKELNLAAWAIANGWNGTATVDITIAPGVYIWSDNVAVAGLTTGIFPGSLTLTNNGYIIGKGGAGAGYTATVGQAGGPAFSIGTSALTLLTGTGYIAGGGGGGGSDPVPVDDNSYGGGGGGAGGGNGGTGVLLSGNKRVAPGGAGGGIGLYGFAGAAGNNVGSGGAGGSGGSGGGAGGQFSHDAKASDARGGGGGGGRLLPSVASAVNGNGSAGGGPEQAGVSGGYISSGGGGWGANGGTPSGGSVGGATGGMGGNAITKNNNVVTIVGSQSLIYGAIA